MRELLELQLYNNSVEAWLYAALTTLICFALLFIVARVPARRLKEYAEATETNLDDDILGLVEKTKSFFLLAASVYVGSLALPTLPEFARLIIEKVAIVALVLQIGLWASSFITSWLARYRDQATHDPANLTTVTTFGYLSKLAVWIVLILVILQNLGVEVTGLITGLGIGGVAVALAVQNILGDVAASLSIVLDKPFVIGDFLVVGDHMGTVEHIGLKSTRIRSLAGEQLIFSNTDLLKSRIRNFKRMEERRVSFELGLTYETPVEKLELVPDIIKSGVEEHEHTRFDRCHFASCSDEALTFETVYIVASPDYAIHVQIQQALNLFILRRFKDEGIQFAYPTRTIYMRS